jgi:hypothetical protein
MSITFSEEEIKQLENAICNSTAKRSYSSHKRDLKKFLISHFNKQKTDNEVDKPKKKLSDKKIISDKKDNGSVDEYNITGVSGDYEYPTSVYKKDAPIKAAQSAMKGIIRKNKLNSSDKFTFSIKKDTRTFKYTHNNGILEAHHGR